MKIFKRIVAAIGRVFKKEDTKSYTDQLDEILERLRRIEKHIKYLGE